MTQPLHVADDPGGGLRAARTDIRPIGLVRLAIDEFRAAMALLTRIPVSGPPVEATGVQAFAVVGALLGATTVVPLIVPGTAMPVAAAILAVALLAVLSGGLHLDGLADTFDALVAVGPDAAERARRDPAVGPAGATALILVLGLDVAALATLVASHGTVVATLACTLAGSVSRFVPAILAGLARSSAADGGLGSWFVRRVSPGDVAVVTATAVLVVLASGLATGGWAVAIGGLAGGVSSVGVGLLLVRLRRTIDGDLLGASVEVAFALTVLAVAMAAAALPA